MDRAEEVAAKLDRVRAWLPTMDHGAALFRSQANFAWLTAGGRSHVSIGEEAGAAWVLVTPSEAHIVTTNIELPRLLDEELGGLPYETSAYPWHAPEDGIRLVKRIAGLGGGHGVADLPIDEGFRAAAGWLWRLRVALLPPEVERYRALGLDAARAVETTARAAELGMTELEISGILAAECRSRDILPLVNLIAVDERIDKYRHPVPTERRLERTLMVVLTGRRHGLHASLTRFVSFGALEQEREARAAATARVDARYLIASRPGTTLAEAFWAGVDQYAQEGYPGEWEKHHQGGLTGYAGRELFATELAIDELDANQALAWNPSITGTKSEDTILVTDGLMEILTRTDDWPEIEVEVEGVRLARPGFLIH